MFHDQYVDFVDKIGEFKKVSASTGMDLEVELDAARSELESVQNVKVVLESKTIRRGGCYIERYYHVFGIR